MNGAAARNAIRFSGAGLLRLGNGISGGSLIPFTGTVEYYGNGAGGTSSNQTIGNYGYNNLITSGNGTKTLAANTTANGTVTVRAGTTLALSTFNLGSPTSLVLEGGATTGSSITGTGTLTLNGNVTVNDANTGTSGATISAPLALGGNRTFTVADDSTPAVDLTVSSIISGAFNLTKDGAGTFTLSGANTYTGATIVNNGTLRAGAGPQAFGVNSAVTLANTAGAILDLNGNNNTIGSLAGGGATGGNVTLGTGTLTLGNNNSSTTYAGVISGTGGITKTGTGTLTLSGVNTFTGSTTISLGTLQLGATGGLPDASPVVLAGGIIRTGATAGFSDTAGTLGLAGTTNSTMALGTGSHTLNFAASNGVAWTSGRTLNITGWTGLNNSGKIFVGNNNTGLTPAQLAQITFTGYSPGAIILPDGEIVPNVAYKSRFISADFGSSTWCAGETRDVTVTIQNIGSATWTNSGPDINVGVKWNSNNPNWLDYYIRTDAENLATGLTQPYTLTLTASNNVGAGYTTPLAAGTNNIIFDLVNEGNFWFGNTSGNSVFTSPNITIVNGPTANAGSNQTVCQGGSLAGLGGSIGGTATLGTWDDGGVGGTFVPNATTLNATWTPPATYEGVATLTLTASGGSCPPTSASKTVRVIGVDGISPNQTVCSGSLPEKMDIFSATGTIQWQRATNPGFSSPTNVGTNSFSLLPAEAGAVTATTYFRAVISEGSCAGVNSPTIIVTVPSNNTETATTSPNYSGCVNAPITPILFTTTGATNIGTPVNLPPGLTAIFVGNSVAGTITISGTPTTTMGSPFSYSIPLTGGCGAINAIGIITLDQSSIINDMTRTVCSGSPFSAIPANGTDGVVLATTTYSWSAPVVTGGITGGAAGTGTFATGITGTLVNPTNTPRTATYSVTPRVGTCDGDPFDVVVTVNPTPVIPNQTIQICSGELFTLLPINGSPTAATIVPAGTTYTWTVADNPNVTGEADQGGPQPSISQTLTNISNTVQTVTYSVTPKSGAAGSCQGTPFTVTVEVRPTPVIPNQTVQICSEAPFTVGPINGSPSAATIVPAGTTYTWTVADNPNVTGESNQGGPQPLISQILTNTSNTIQTVTYTVIPTSGAAGSCIGNSFTIDVEVLPRPSITPMTASVCSGELFTVSPVNGTNGIVPAGTSYSWSVVSVTGGITGAGPGSGSNINGTLTNPTNTAQTATYSVIPSVGGCAGTPFTLTVTVNPAPAVTAMAESVCSGELFTASPANGTNGIVPAGTSYSWTVQSVTGGITGAGPGSGSNITGTLTNPTNTAQTATYSVIPSVGGCAGTPFTLTVTVNPAPAVTAMAESVCSGELFTASPANGTNGIVPAGTSYSWTVQSVTGGITGAGPGSGSNITGTLTNPTNTAQTATYSVIPSVGGCAGTPFTLTVTVNPAPAVTSMTSAVCNGDPFTVTPANGTNGIVPTGTTYSWTLVNVTGGMTGGASGSGTSITGTLNNPTTSQQTATYSVIPTSGSCVGSSFTVTVTVNPLTNLTDQPSTLNYEVCFGDGFAPISVTATGANLTYQWYSNTTNINSGGTLISGATSANFTPPSTPEGEAYYYTVVTGTCGTVTSNVSGKYTVSPPDTQFTTNLTNTPQTICPGGSFTPISAVATGPNLTYRWYSNTTPSNSGGTLIAGETSGSFTPPNTVFGPIYYYVEAKSDCGTVPSQVSGAFTITGSTSAAPDQTVCLNTALNPVITHSTTGTTGIGTITGLPPGVTATWAANAITISGTPTSTAGSPFNYSIQLIGACTNQYATGTITVDPIPTVTNATLTQTICSGETTTAVTLTSAVPGATFTWTATATAGVTGFTASGTNTIPVQTIATTGTDQGTVTYAITPSFNGCPGPTTNYTVLVNPKPTVTNASLTQTICSGETTTAVTLTPSVPGATFTWTATATAGVTGFTASGTNTIPVQTISTTGTDQGTVTYAITPSFNGCPGPTTNYTVLVNPRPTVTNASLTQTICSGEATTAVTLTSAVPGATFTWTATATAGVTGFTASGTNTIPVQTISTTVTTQGTVTYAITPSFNGCSGPTTNYTVLINPKPTVTNASLTQTICSGASTTAVTLTSSVPGATFAWTTTATAGVTGFTASGTNTIPAQTISTTGTDQGTVTYAITPSFNGCPGPTTNYTVLVNPIPTVSNPSLTQTICSGETTTAVTLTSAVPGTTFAWTATATAGVTGFTASGTNTIPVQTIATTGTDQGSVTYAITPSFNGCPGPTTNYTVLVNPKPTVTNASLTQTICSGETTTAVTLTPSVPGATFTWTATATAGVTGFTASGTNTIPVQTISTTGTDQGTVTYAITPSFNGCPGPTTNYTVLVNPRPTVTNASLTQIICSGETTTAVTLTSAVPGATFTWTATATAGVTGFTASGTNTIPVQNISTTGTTQGTVTYAITPSFNGCPGPITNYTVLVNPIPTVSNPSLTQTICSGASTTAVTLTSAVPGASFTWTATATAGVTGFTASGTNTIPVQTISTTANTQGTVTYSITPSFNGCPGPTTNYTVLVNPRPAISPSPITTSICSGQTFDISPVNGTNGLVPTGTTYTWTVANNGNVGGETDQTTPQPSISQTLTNITTSVQTVIYTVTPRNGTCPGASFEVQVNVNPIPTVIDPADQTLCSGTSTAAVNFTGNGVSGVVYNWTNSNTSIGLAAASGSGDIPAFTTLNTGSSPVTSTITVTPVANGCSGTPQTFTITVNPTPVVSIQADYCVVAGKVRLTANSSVSGVTWSWNTYPVQTTQTIDVDIAGTYVVTATSGASCVGIGSISVAEELVINGSFTAGNTVDPAGITGFATDYMYLEDLTGVNDELIQDDGTRGYSITTNGQNVHTLFFGQDHTNNVVGPRNMMIVNGKGGALRIWEKTITVKPNTEYYFSAWAMSVNAVGPFARLRFQVNGAQVGTIANLLSGVNDNTNNGWQRFNGTWNSGSVSGPITVQIVNLEPALGGNDFAIDDISFGTFSTFIELTSPVDSDNQTVCQNFPIDDITYAARSSIAGPTVSGLPSGVTTSWNGVTLRFTGTPTASGTFTYTVTNTGNCSPATVTGTITVLSTPTSGIISADQVICSGGDPVTIVSSTNGTGAGLIDYLWESNTNLTTPNWTTISGETGATYDIPAGLITTTQFRRTTIATSGTVVCQSIPTEPVQVTVQAVPTPGVIAGAQTICSGGDPANLTNATFGTGSGTITYRWESAVSPFSSWTAISGADGGTYNPPSGLIATTQYRRVTISTTNGILCESIPTNPIQVTVQSTPTAGVIAAAQTICSGEDPAAFTSTIDGTGDGTITYRWESAVGPFSSWTAISGADGATYIPPSGLIATTQYRRVTISTLNSVACESAPTTPVEVTITPTNTVTPVTPNPSLCVGVGISTIIHTTTGATGIANDGVSGANGLPLGISATWSGNTITIMGIPVEQGVFPYSILLTGGCGSVNATGTITVDNPSYPITNIDVVNPTSLPGSSTFTVYSPNMTPGTYEIRYSTNGVNGGANNVLTTVVVSTSGQFTLTSPLYSNEGTTVLTINSIQRIIPNPADPCPYFPPNNNTAIYGFGCSSEYLQTGVGEAFFVPADVFEITVTAYGDNSPSDSQTMPVIPGGVINIGVAGNTIFATESPVATASPADYIVSAIGPNGRIVFTYDCSPPPPCSSPGDVYQYTDSEGYTVIRVTGDCSGWTWSAPDGLDEFEVLVVGGGGGGGYGEAAGGGGGGAVIYEQYTGITMSGLPGLQGASFTITPGGLGLGATTSANKGGNGQSSSMTGPAFNHSGGTFTNFSADGGGGGGSTNSSASIRQGASGASGGGGAAFGTDESAGGAGSTGSIGGTGYGETSGTGGGGGGGAAGSGGAAGYTGVMTGGSGGIGVARTISGENIYYGAGGGGTSSGAITNVAGEGGNPYTIAGVDYFAGGSATNNGVGQSPTTYGSGGGAGRIGGASGFPGVIYIRYPNFRILPIEFLFFNAKYNPIFRSGDLTWETANEWENDRFEIERSVNDVKSWETIGQVQGAGYSDQAVEYVYQDMKLPLAGGTIFYRLKQIDFDGDFTYSDTKAIQVEAMAGTTYWRVYPNPTTGNPTHLEMIDTGAYDNEEITVRVISATGVFEVIEGTSSKELSLQLSEILRTKAAGIYTVEISWGANREYHKVILVR
ncbi:PKD-like domain-containing protein [Algoriphagus sp. A40]|uniref:PKD-like domain-containing protein n=1 Tax=Algoriphagus sp. A40 TaxID=1945863 RepID=UPI0014398E0A|nr:PKD-like domain-containing protein [Algoriphagus sp. A40]